MIGRVSLKNQKITALSQRISRIRALESKSRNPFARLGLKAWRWFWMLHHEFIRDDVHIRAESLAFLMVFSLLPLIAGGFFVFNIFMKFGFVQEGLENFLLSFLDTIPSEHRLFVSDYVIKFKDSYLNSMAQKSGSIGIFAMLFLGWVGLKTFTNIEKTLNQIWSSDNERPFLERLRNFVVVAIGAPTVLVSALSIPLILQRQAGNFLTGWLSLLTTVFNAFLSPLIIFFTMAAIYRYVPVRKVPWKATLVGGIFATVGLELANHFMKIYFQYGTYTGYGKAAIVPLLGFWIYVVWIIVILGAEVSYLMEHGKDLFESKGESPAVRDGQALLHILCELNAAHHRGDGPLSYELLYESSGISTQNLRGILDYLEETGFVAVVGIQRGHDAIHFMLGRSLKGISVKKILEDYYGASWSIVDSPLAKTWDKGLSTWMSYFENLEISDLSRPRRA